MHTVSDGKLCLVFNPFTCYSGTGYLIKSSSWKLTVCTYSQFDKVEKKREQISVIEPLGLQVNDQEYFTDKNSNEFAHGNLISVLYNFMSVNAAFLNK